LQLYFRSKRPDPKQFRLWWIR